MFFPVIMEAGKVYEGMLIVVSKHDSNTCVWSRCGIDHVHTPKCCCNSDHLVYTGVTSAVDCKEFVKINGHKYKPTDLIQVGLTANMFNAYMHEAMQEPEPHVRDLMRQGHPPTALCVDFANPACQCRNLITGMHPHCGRYATSVQSNAEGQYVALQQCVNNGTVGGRDYKEVVE